jgi:hypothetical protein
MMIDIINNVMLQENNIFLQIKLCFVYKINRFINLLYVPV